MNGIANWSFRALTIFGIEVRIHLFLVLFWVGTLYKWANPQDLAWTLGFGVAFVALFWLSILLHEFGHCFAARARGLEANQVLLWPLGGLAFVGEGAGPREEIFVAAAGPAVTAGLCAIFGGAAFILAPASSGWEVLNPFSAWLPADGSDFAPFLCRALFRANGILLLFNVLVPAYPMDGGRILRGGLTLRLGFERATMIATAVAIGAAIVLGLLGVATRDLAIVGLGIWIFLVARQERILLREGALDGQGQTFLGHDFSMGYTSLARGDEAERERRRRGPGLAARIGKLVGRARPTPEEKRPPPPPPEPEKEQLSLRQQVDRILEKVSKTGLAGLTQEERDFLSSASKKFQSMRKPD